MTPGDTDITSAASRPGCSAMKLKYVNKPVSDGLLLDKLAALAYYYATVGLVDTLAVEVVHSVVGSGGLDGHITDTGGISDVMGDDIGDVES